jgi:hypothetical protein
MGKRELLLICGFVVVGALVYHSTAPAAAPGQQRFSVSRILDHVRREVRGNRASAELTTTRKVPIRPGTAEIRFETGNAPLTITGEDREDVDCELQVWSSGYDETEAKRYAGETAIKSTDAGVSMVLSITYPEPATQRATLIVRMPKALAVRVQPSRGKVEISNVSSVELVEARGQATIRKIDGRLTATHRGGNLTIESVDELKLNTRGSTINLKDIAGEAMMTLQAGELRGESLAGPIEIESNGTRVELENLTATRKPLRINAVGGSVKLAGVKSDTRIDGRDTRITVTVEKPAPLAIYNEAEELTEVTLPPGGYQLDALTTDGHLTVPEGMLDVKSTDNEQRATGTIGAGGPTITLRTKRGDIKVSVRKSEV